MLPAAEQMVSPVASHSCAAPILFKKNFAAPGQKHGAEVQKLSGLPVGISCLFSLRLIRK
jgi:hypothetical protein